MKAALALLTELSARLGGTHHRLALERAESGDRLVVEFVTADRVPRFILDDADLELPPADLLDGLAALHEVHKDDPIPTPRPAVCGADPSGAWRSILDAAVLYRLSDSPIWWAHLERSLAEAFGFTPPMEQIQASLERLGAVESIAGWMRPKPAAPEGSS